jgi:hypothetical protein
MASVAWATASPLLGIGDGADLVLGPLGDGGDGAGDLGDSAPRLVRDTGHLLRRGRQLLRGAADLDQHLDHLAAGGVVAGQRATELLDHRVEGVGERPDLVIARRRDRLGVGGDLGGEVALGQRVEPVAQLLEVLGVQLRDGAQDAPDAAHQVAREQDAHRGGDDQGDHGEDEHEHLGARRCRGRRARLGLRDVVAELLHRRHQVVVARIGDAVLQGLGLGSLVRHRKGHDAMVGGDPARCQCAQAGGVAASSGPAGQLVQLGDRLLEGVDVVLVVDGVLGPHNRHRL